MKRLMQKPDNSSCSASSSVQTTRHHPYPFVPLRHHLILPSRQGRRSSRSQDGGSAGPENLVINAYALKVSLPWITHSDMTLHDTSKQCKKSPTFLHRELSLRRSKVIVKQDSILEPDTGPIFHRRSSSQKAPKKKGKNKSKKQGIYKRN